MENMYFIGINNLYEKPGRWGYTTSIFEAGIYDEKTAMKINGREDAHGDKRWAKPVLKELEENQITIEKLDHALIRLALMKSAIIEQT